METKRVIDGIQKLKVQGKIVEQPIEGGEKGETERILVTSVTFEYEGNPGQLDEILWAMVSGHRIDVAFQSPQASFDSVTFKSGEKEVTLK
jgi:hypothetical protein